MPHIDPPWGGWRHAPEAALRRAMKQRGLKYATVKDAIDTLERWQRDAGFDHRSTRMQTEIARLEASHTELLARLEDLMGDLDIDLIAVVGGHFECLGCGREYSAMLGDNDGSLRCPDEDCPRHKARTAIAEAKCIGG